jgi:hypothetical protein
MMMEKCDDEEGIIVGSESSPPAAKALQYSTETAVIERKAKTQDLLLLSTSDLSAHECHGRNQTTRRMVYSSS